MVTCLSAFPTGPFTILWTQNQEIGEFYFLQKYHATNCEASKL